MILPGQTPTILEKPLSKADQLRMLESYQGVPVVVATGVTIGAVLSRATLPALPADLSRACSATAASNARLLSVIARVVHQGACSRLKSRENLAHPLSQQIHFADNSSELLQAYVDCGEGIDRCVSRSSMPRQY